MLQAEQPETVRAGLSQPDHPVGPPRGQFVRPFGKPGRQRFGPKLLLARIDHVRIAVAVEPVGRGARHGAIGGNAVEHEIEHKT